MFSCLCMYAYMYACVAVSANYQIANIIEDIISATFETASPLFFYLPHPFLLSLPLTSSYFFLLPSPFPPRPCILSSPLSSPPSPLSLPSTPKGIVVGVPSPCPADQTVQDAIESALKEASKLGVKGSKITPFVLAAIEKITKGTLRYFRQCLFSV